MTNIRPTDHEAALQRYVRSPFNPARKQGFKSAVPPEAFETPRDYEEMTGEQATEIAVRVINGGFAILCGLMLGIATVMGLAMVKAWPWISGWFA